MKGSELLQLASEISPSTAVVLLMAYPGDAVVLDGVRDLALVGKPWDDEGVRKLIRDLIEQRRGPNARQNGEIGVSS